MNESEVRLRLRQAIGNHRIPAGLEQRAQARLMEREHQSRAPRLLGLVAVGLALLMVAALVGLRLSTAYRHYVPAVSPSPAVSAKPTQLPLPPSAVLAAAHLDQATALVTPFDISSTSNGITVKLVGAYADAARTVTILDADPAVMPSGAEMDDSAGLMNYSSGGAIAAAPYAIYAVDGPPKQDSDGLAHIRLTFTQLQDRIPPGQQSWPPPPSHQGHWVFEFAIPVHPGQKLDVPSSTLTVGAVPVTLEVVEATPSVIHVQALVTAQGQSVLSALGRDFLLQLLDENGQGAPTVAAGGGVTAPKQQLTPQSADVVRLNYQWARTAAGGRYVIRFRYQGATVDTPVTIPPVSQRIELPNRRTGSAPSPACPPGTHEVSRSTPSANGSYWVDCLGEG